VRVWQIVRSSTQNQRRVCHVCTLVGHTAAITCIDMSTEFSIIVSGGMDNVVCVWDFRSKRLLRVLPDHRGPLLSVSINAMSGQIATLTLTQLRLYTINGELLSYANPSNPTEGGGGLLSMGRADRLHSNSYSSGNIGSSGAVLPAPCVVLAAPCGNWQDGVVLVTGHKEGYVYLWKLGKPVLDDDNDDDAGTGAGADASSSGAESPAAAAAASTSSAKYSTSSATSPSERKVTAYVTTNNKIRFRELYISSVPMKVHKASITVLRLCSVTAGKAKDSITKAVDESRELDLLVGDAEGFVSRWTPVRLDQLNSTDLGHVLSSASVASSATAASASASASNLTYASMSVSGTGSGAGASGGASMGSESSSHHHVY
jgi:WD40 repeat protein